MACHEKRWRDVAFFSYMIKREKTLYSSSFMPDAMDQYNNFWYGDSDPYIKVFSKDKENYKLQDNGIN